MANKPTKGKRGLAFTARELENLADTVEEIVPIGHTEWDRVRDKHNEIFPDQNRTTESLRRKFQWMVKMKIPTGDPNMPRHIRVAKRANYAIVKATDGSTGSPARDLSDDDEDDGGDEEEGAEGDTLDDVSNEDDGDSGEVVFESGNTFDTSDGIEDDVNGMSGSGLATATSVATATTVATARATAGMTTGGGGGKRAGEPTRGGGKKKKSSAFKQPLRIPRRSPSSSVASDDGEGGGDGWSFGNMMHMMMMQHRMDNEQREQQRRIDSEQRDREYQLRREEMAMAREETREQRQLMNLMLMSMLRKDGGTDNTSNPTPPSSSPDNA
jgi:hypothetical protein